MAKEKNKIESAICLIQKESATCLTFKRPDLAIFHRKKDLGIFLLVISQSSFPKKPNGVGHGGSKVCPDIKEVKNPTGPSNDQVSAWAYLYWSTFIRNRKTETYISWKLEKDNEVVEKSRSLVTRYVVKRTICACLEKGEKNWVRNVSIFQQWSDGLMNGGDI